MSQWHGGKGSKRRNTNDKAYSDNWDKIFKKEIKMKVEIYGKSRCTYCDAAKNISKQRNIDHEYFMLDADYTEEEFFEKFPTARTFPQIIVNGESIGGYQQYIDKLDNEN